MASEEKKIRQALDAAGYSSSEPTFENLVECFFDYVVCGAWSNISDLDELLDDINIGEITSNDMCRALLNL